MPIEFHCGQCGQLLRVPDDSVGKAARCPKCQGLMTVPTGPAASSASQTFVAAASPPPGAPDAQQAKNPFADQGSSSPFGGPVKADLNPYASPSAGPLVQPYSFPYGARPGLPWETQRHTLGCWFRTMGLVLGSPSQAFLMMHKYGGLGTPITYNLYAVGMLLAVVMVFAVPIAFVFFAMAAAQNNGPQSLLAIAAMSGVFAVVAIAYVAFLTTIMPLVWAGLSHLMLMLVGGAREGFETTFRVTCYAYFSVLLPGTLVSIVPYLGGFIMLIWVIVLFVIGFSRAHEIPSGKAAAAVLIPLIVCCGLYIALAATFVFAPFLFNGA